MCNCVYSQCCAIFYTYIANVRQTRARIGCKSSIQNENNLEIVATHLHCQYFADAADVVLIMLVIARVWASVRHVNFMYKLQKCKTLNQLFEICYNNRIPMDTHTHTQQCSAVLCRQRKMLLVLALIWWCEHHAPVLSSRSTKQPNFQSKVAGLFKKGITFSFQLKFNSNNVDYFVCQTKSLIFLNGF